MPKLIYVKQCIRKETLKRICQSFVLPTAFALAHRALAAAEILARPAALIVDFFFTTGLAAGLATGVLALAQRAFCAAAILARAAALIFVFFFGAGVGVEAFAGEPRMEASSFSKALIWSLMSAACFSCAEVSDNRLLMVKPV